MFPIDFSVKPINYIYFISWWLWIRRYSTRLVALISGGYEVLNWNNSGSEHREGKGDHHGLQETKRQLFTFLGTTISTNLSWSAKAQRVVHTTAASALPESCPEEQQQPEVAKNHRPIHHGEHPDITHPSVGFPLPSPPLSIRHRYILLSWQSADRHLWQHSTPNHLFDLLPFGRR